MKKNKITNKRIDKIKNEIAGFRYKYYKNVVNIEICNFITTDIRCFAEKIPLKDNSVDFLLSLAVLEHVVNPFQVAEEIERIFKPGGLLVIDTAFMQGRHGFPHHYYNMTFEGLLNLFTKIDVHKKCVIWYQHSTYSIYWLLRTFNSGLQDADKEKFHISC